MNNKIKRDVQVRFNTTKEEKELLEYLAFENEMKISEFIRFLIKEFNKTGGR